MTLTPEHRAQLREQNNRVLANSFDGSQAKVDAMLISLLLDALDNAEKHNEERDTRLVEKAAAEQRYMSLTHLAYHFRENDEAYSLIQKVMESNSQFRVPAIIAEVDKEMKRDA